MNIKKPNSGFYSDEGSTKVPDEVLKVEPTEQPESVVEGNDNDSTDDMRVKPEINEAEDASNTSSEVIAQDQKESTEKTSQLIPGQCRVRLQKQDSTIRGLRVGSKTFEVYSYIEDRYGLNQPYITEELYETFLKRGYNSSDISGHLHSLKKQGFLVAEEWTEEELATYGQGRNTKIRKNLKKWMLVKKNPTKKLQNINGEPSEGEKNEQR